MSVQNAHLLAKYDPGIVEMSELLQEMDAEEERLIHNESEERDRAFINRCTPTKVAAGAWIGGCCCLQTLFFARIFTLTPVSSWLACIAFPSFFFCRYAPPEVQAECAKVYCVLCCGPCCRVLSGGDIDPSTLPSANVDYENDSDKSWDKSRLERLATKVNLLSDRLETGNILVSERKALDYFKRNVESFRTLGNRSYFARKEI